MGVSVALSNVEGFIGTVIVTLSRDNDCRRFFLLVIISSSLVVIISSLVIISSSCLGFVIFLGVIVAVEIVVTSVEIVRFESP